MEVIIVIDGTGPVSDRKYREEFKNSFCKRISQMSLNATYYRGVPGEPDEIIKSLMVSVDGQVRELAERAHARIGHSALAHAQRETKLWGRLAREIPIYLVGYSRGGLACVELAETLQKRDYNVEAMYLFDAVNMTAWPLLRGYVIPKNVKKCYHAMRNPEFFTEHLRKAGDAVREVQEIYAQAGGRPGMLLNNARYAAARKKSALAHERLNLTRSNTRSLLYNWGNCALKHAGEAWQLEIEYRFMGSHGAMGGLPWPPEVFPRDEKCEADVKKWMWERLSLRPPGGDNERIEAVRRIVQTA